MKSNLLLIRNLFFTSNLMLLVVFFVVTEAGAQDAMALVKKGTREYNEGNVTKAQKHFEKALKQDIKNAEARFFIALCYLESHVRQPAKALRVLKTVKQSEISAPKEVYYYYLAMAYHQNLEFDKALELLGRARGKGIDYRAVRLLKSNIESAQLNYNMPKKGLVVKNLGTKINSRDMEYSAVMMDNYRTILYTARKPRVRNGKIADDGLSYESIYKVSLDKNDKWQRPVKVMGSLNPKQHNATVQMLPEEGKLVVYRDGNLYLTDYEEGSWGKGQKIKPINSMADEVHCFIANGGKTIFYSSNLNSKNGDLDIYVIHQDRKGDWKEPRPVTAANTPYDDDSPYLAEDGTLYFSSKGHDSMGGHDIFSLPYDSTTRRWGEVQNLGYPINTVFDDIFFNTSGKFAYMSSTRTNGRGSLDLLGVYLFDRIRIKGRVIDSKNGAVEGASITMKHGDEVYRTVTEERGGYEIVIPFEKTLDVLINKGTDTLIRDKINVNIYFGEREEEYNFLLQRAEETEDTTSSSVPISYYSIKNDSIDDGKKAKFENGAFSLKYFTINDISNNDLISSERVPDKYLVLNDGQDSDGETEEAEEGEVVKSGDEMSEEERARRQNSLESTHSFASLQLLYQFDSHHVKSEYRENLDSLAVYLKNNANKKAVLTGHTDSTGPASYNLKLSRERAEAAAKYLLANGVKAEQLITVWKGETEPQSSNETRLGRSQNRRVSIEAK